jgi:hypothetical protein
LRFWRIGTRTILALSVLIGATGAAGVAAAQDQPPQTPGEVLQAGVSKMQSDNKLPGVIGMVRDGDKVDYAGYGDMFMRVPADPQAQFRIGSNTKQFTPTVLLSQRLNHPSRIPEGGFTNYALGVGRIGTKCGEVYTHTGEVPGYTSTWISSGDGERQVVVADNEYHMLKTDATDAEWNTAVDAFCATA